MTDALLTVLDQKEARKFAYANGTIENRREPMKVSIQDKKALFAVSPAALSAYARWEKCSAVERDPTIEAVLAHEVKSLARWQ